MERDCSVRVEVEAKEARAVQVPVAGTPACLRSENTLWNSGRRAACPVSWLGQVQSEYCLIHLSLMSTNDVNSLYQDYIISSP